MTLQNFLKLFMMFGIENAKRSNWKEYGNMSYAEVYKKEFVLLPMIYCKDGFHISIQIANGNYCASENGYRIYGDIWVTAEWGFPSEEIDADKYNAEDADYEYYDNNGCVGKRLKSTTDCVGSCDVTLLQELLDEHGGIDMDATANNFKAKYE